MNRFSCRRTNRLIRRPLVPALGLAFLLAAAPAHPAVVFTDVSATAGVDSEHYQSQTIHSLGPNWIDYDNDNLPDLFMVGGNSENTPRLYHNEGNGRFSPAEDLLPVLPAYEMSGSVFADYDNDGDVDIYIYTDHRNLVTDPPPNDNPHDGPPNLLLKNLFVENGHRIEAGVPLFEEVAALAGVDDLAPDEPFGPDWPGHRSKTAFFFDYDRDGCVDLYVGHWVMRWGQFGIEANRDRLYRNNCDGTFSDATDVSGIAPDSSYYRASLASIGAHFDDDLWPDIYAVTGTNEPDPSHWDIYLGNNGDGTFTDRTLTNPEVGDDAQAGMGIDVADVDHDGDWDFYMSDLRQTTHDELPKGNVYYLGTGGGVFTDNLILEHDVQGDNSWGINFFDIDHDTYEDLFVAGMINTPSFIYMNDHDATFTDVWGAQGLTTTNLRGSATADLERDGDVDLMVVNQNGPAQMWRNDTTEAGNWLQIKLIGSESNRAAIGAVVELDVGGATLKRQVKGGSSGHGQDDLVVHFGLGAALTADEIRVLWPSGLVDVLPSVAANGLIAVIEGTTATPHRHRVNAAGGNYLDAAGRDFPADQPYHGGSFGHVGGGEFFFDFPISGTEDDTLYQHMRGKSVFDYDFDLPNGFYAIDLLFAEPYFNTAGSRLFDVTVEGVIALDDFDISAVAGGRRNAHTETLFTEVADGQLNIGFEVVVSQNALVSAISIRQLVFPMNAGGATFLDANRVLFEADASFSSGDFGYTGGRAYQFVADVVGTEDDELYLSMRAGRSFGYSLAGIPDGDYEIELFFTEPFLKPGRRLFDVAVEGQVLLDDFDIAAAANGRWMAHSEVVNATVADGQLDIDFDVEVGGKALVSALRVTKLADPPALPERLPPLAR